MHTGTAVTAPLRQPTACRTFTTSGRCLRTCGRRCACCHHLRRSCSAAPAQCARRSGCSQASATSGSAAGRGRGSGGAARQRVQHRFGGFGRTRRGCISGEWRNTGGGPGGWVWGRPQEGGVASGLGFGRSHRRVRSDAGDSALQPIPERHSEPEPVGARVTEGRRAGGEGGSASVEQSISCARRAPAPPSLKPNARAPAQPPGWMYFGVTP